MAGHSVTLVYKVGLELNLDSNIRKSRQNKNLLHTRNYKTANLQRSLYNAKSNIQGLQLLAVAVCHYNN